jgi:hypothetical protein
MQRLFVFLTGVIFLSFAACKSDVPNPAPKVALVSPTPEKPSKNRVSKPIPIKFSVNDKDGLSSISVEVTQKPGGSPVTSPIPVPAVANGYVVVDTNFVIAALPAGKDSLVYWVVINATDGAGNTFTHTSNFKVYK